MSDPVAEKAREAAEKVELWANTHRLYPFNDPTGIPAAVVAAIAAAFRPLFEQHERALSALTVERDNLQAHLADAAREINCAGTVAHRIQVLKQEHERALAEARVAGQAEMSAALERGLRGEPGSWPDWIYTARRENARLLEENAALAAAVDEGDPQYAEMVRRLRTSERERDKVTKAVLAISATWADPKTTLELVEILGESQNFIGEALSQAVTERDAAQDSLRVLLTPEKVDASARALALGLEVRKLMAERDAAQVRVKALTAAVAWCYQFAGIHDASVEALDNLSALAQGNPTPHEWPWIPTPPDPTTPPEGK